MSKAAYYAVNGITFYRLLAAPVLGYFIFTQNIAVFKWLLAISFFTDLIDGFLARRYKVVSVTGSRIDSVADDLTVLAAIIGLVVFKLDFLKQEFVLLGILLVLYLCQLTLSLVRYKKITSFHTYTAKVAAILQGVFFILVFFLPHPVMALFYCAAIATILDLTEEILLALMLPKWKADVKGLYWLLKKKRVR